MNTNDQAKNEEQKLKVAKDRFKHLITRQLPVDFYATKTFMGIKFDDVSIENDKLLITLNSCF